MLQPSPDMGDTCLVEWASGSQRVYETGNDGRFELVHLEMSKNSGAPVVGEDWTGMELKRHELLWDGLELKRPAFLSMSRAVGGTVVERGTHWTYGGAEPGLGSITKAEQAQAKPGKPLACVVRHVHIEICLYSSRSLSLLCETSQDPAAKQL